MCETATPRTTPEPGTHWLRSPRPCRELRAGDVAVGDRHEPRVEVQHGFTGEAPEVHGLADGPAQVSEAFDRGLERAAFESGVGLARIVGDAVGEPAALANSGSCGSRAAPGSKPEEASRPRPSRADGASLGRDLPEAGLAR